MAARFHVIGDRTDRTFAKAERSVRRGQFEEAVRWFDAAIETDPSYAHLYLYKGIALAEMDRPEDGLREIEKGSRLAPSNPMFPMSAGCINLDEGDIPSARGAFERAATFAPGNRVVAGYRALTSYMAGDAGAIAQMKSVVDLTPASFQARLLMAIPGSESATQADKPDTTSPSLLTRIEKWFFDRKAQRLFDGGEFESFVDVVEGAPPAWQSALQDRVAAARKQALRKLKDEINRSGSRELLLRSANVRGTDVSGQAGDLSRWLEGYRANKAKKETTVAASVLVVLADLKRKDGQFQTAIELCGESRSLESVPEVDWIEAQARHGAGQKRLARRLFERFEAAESLTFRDRVLERLQSQA